MRRLHKFNNKFNNKKSQRRGAALVEFAIIIPVFLTLVLGVMEMGQALKISNDLTASVRGGGRLASMDWSDVVPDSVTTNEKVAGDIRNFLTASGLSSSAVDITITSAEGTDQGQNFDLADPTNELRLFRITASVPFSAVSTYPSYFMSGQTVKASLVFRTGRTF